MHLSGEHPERVLFGLTTPGGPFAANERIATCGTLGVLPALVLWFADFGTPPPIPGAAFVTEGGAVPVITWEPWKANRVCPDVHRSCRLRSIASGTYDAYLRRWADALAAWGSAAYLRFAHEFNGDWYPWTVKGGTPPALYVDAWRHVHEVFSDAAADNVFWIWAASAGGPTNRPLTAWYPGDDYVDALGIDGYNWGCSQPWSRWVAPAALFDSSLAELRNINSHKPILITEVASAEAGGDKPQWIADFVGYLDEQPDVMGFIWFDHDKETDWRLSSTPAAVKAMALAMSRQVPS